MLERTWARDRAFDGRFIAGVLTTGIYCRPSCPARRPRPENVRFFASPADARAAGLRPCRRCRPEEWWSADPEAELAAALLDRLRRNPAAFPGTAALAAAAGVGTSRLNALLRRQLHRTPGELLRRERAAAAARRLLEGGETVLDVGFAVGFESASTFHAAFRERIRMRPGDYRRLGRGGSFTLLLPDDFRPDLTLSFLGRDPDSPTERVAAGTLVRVLGMAEGPARLTVELARGAARCRLEAAGPLSPASWAAGHGAALRLLGLDGDPRPFEERLRRRRLDRLVEGRRGLRIPQSATPFEGLTWAIVGQQVNLAFAYRLRQRLVALAGRPAGGGLAAHPTAAEIARLDPADLARLQFSRRKAEYLVDAARAVAGGDLPLDDLARGPAPALEGALTAQRGIGPWTARYVMLRACGFADCVPVGDSGLTAALARFYALDTRPDPARTEELMLPFAPFRSFATTHLWTSLGGPA